LFKKLLIKAAAKNMNNFIFKNQISFIQEFSDKEIKDILSSHAKDIGKFIDERGE